MLDLLEHERLLWTGVFAAGDGSFDFYSFVPAAAVIVAVSHGQAYVVKPEGQREWVAVPGYMIKAAVVADDCIILHDDWGLYAIWDLHRIGHRDLDCDGIYDVTAGGGIVEGYCDTWGREGQPFRITLDVSSFEMLAYP